MNWISWNAKFVFTAIFIIQIDAGVRTWGPLPMFKKTNTMMYKPLWTNNEHQVWSEYITNPNGTIILRDSVSVAGPRQQRYVNYKALTFKSLRLDDGGRYRCSMPWPGSDDDIMIVLDLLVIGDIKCNGSDTHVGIVGENITYACSFEYQGSLFEDMMQWYGPGVGATHHYHETLEVVTSAEPNTCYAGEVVYTTTLTVTPDLNATTRWYKYGRYYQKYVDPRTGLLIVKSAVSGTVGPDTRQAPSGSGKSANAMPSYKYLTVLLVLPLIAAGVAAYLIYRRKNRG